ncbi:MAG: hypothetical protein DSZ28_06745 [Thiothrix sp.]|nr:MAG: hypothetical protein DSZ28_06745 [Thiothrix sp.]
MKYVLSLILFVMSPLGVGAEPIFANQATDTAARSDVRSGYFRSSRYGLQRDDTQSKKHDLLGVIYSYKFPNAITVGQALIKALGDSGYGLADPAASDPNLGALLSAPLPNVHRELGPARLDRILETLAGPAWVLVSDPVNRLVSFDLKEKFWPPCQYTAVSKRPCRP